VSVVKAADAAGVSGQTGDWQSAGTPKGLTGLFRGMPEGIPSKLIDEQKAELLELLREKDHWTTVDAQRLILSHFGVAYSLSTSLTSPPI